MNCFDYKLFFTPPLKPPELNSIILLLIDIVLSKMGEIAMYLDPGFGSMILQLILAGLLGIGVFIRIFWKKIKALFGKKEKDILEMDDDLNDEE